MNKKIIIKKEGEKWFATLVEYDSLPFGKIPDNTIDEVESESFSELMTEIGNKAWIDLINKNH